MTLFIPSTSLYTIRCLEESLKEMVTAKMVQTKNWALISWRYLLQGIHRYKKRRSVNLCGILQVEELLTDKS